MDIERLYLDYSVPHATEGHKHCREGWIQTACPYCTGNPGLHLGFNFQDNYYVCWRCGWHPIGKTIALLLNINEYEAKQRVRQYGGRVLTHQKDTSKRSKTLKLPTGVVPLSNSHKQYLSRRGFDPDRLEQEWNLMSTGPISKLGDTDYKHRILAPIEWDGERVSFTSRDVTDKSPYKYKACSGTYEVINLKSILYGNQEKWRDTAICVEGPTDVWRFGEIAICTFGIKYTPSQLRWMARIFKKVVIIYDNEKQAQIQATALEADLRFRGLTAWNIQVDTDPGAMSQDDADHLIKTIL